MDQVTSLLEQMSREADGLAVDDIPRMGRLINLLSDIREAAAEAAPAAFVSVCAGLSGYFEKLVLFEAEDTGPVAEALLALSGIWSAGDGAETSETGGLLARLGFETAPESPPAPVQAEVEAEPQAVVESLRNLSTEDVQILSDFVMESLENLESIEINLIDLEQDPGDKETINAIFRPFHTIKGVSGFLNLPRINRLSHATENLLDGPRQEKFPITDTIIDMILRSVDTLKRLIGAVEQCLEVQTCAIEGDIDVEPLIEEIRFTAQKAEAAAEMPLGEILVDRGALDQTKLEQGLTIQKGDPSRKIGEILIDEQMADSREVLTAIRDQKRSKRSTDLQIRVDTAKLDNLIDLTGELVISQSMLRQSNVILSSGDHALFQNLNQLTQIVSGLQKTAMSMRMVPIKSTFQKMVRLVRDLARNSGKKVRLSMAGEETEIDRNVVEELYEPLVHMIRNAVDHGLERPEERTSRNKSATGGIALKAYHKGGSIVIEIRDDGKGLDKTRIIEKAVSVGLIKKDHKLTDPEIFDLIFQPGFSTAKKLTDVSGRGVGMDVVKKGIEKLRGKLDIRSTPGKGTVFTISLPLTLAIIEGMIVRVGKERYILPTMAILESFKPKKEDCHTVEGRGEMVKVRGRLVPVLRLNRVFDVTGDAANPWDGLVVAVEHKVRQMALLLDEVLGKEEVVIKSLGESLKNVRGLAGGAILGDGRVGLILDMEGLFEIADSA